MHVADTRSTITHRRAVAALVAVMAGSVTMALASASPASALEPSPNPSIVGGNPVTAIEQAPFQVALYDPELSPDPVNSQFCGGVILDATHVLTAAHCVFNETTGQASAPNEIEVLAGAVNLDTVENKEATEQEDPVSITSFDPEWRVTEGGMPEHDLGVLTLKEPLKLGRKVVALGKSTIAAIPLLDAAQKKSFAEPPAIASVSGWGDTNPEAPGSPRPSYSHELRTAEVPIVGNAACATDYGLAAPLSEVFVCAGGAGNDACYGDSGGPLVVDAAPGQLEGDRLLGTVDLGRGCGQSGFPGIYQSVLNTANREFATSEPPQAPLKQLGPALVGTAQPEGRLTCNPGAWSVQPAKREYEFFADMSTFSEPGAFARLSALSTSNSYLVPSGLSAGTRVFCVEVASNPGGYAEAFSPDVTLGDPPAPSSPTEGSQSREQTPSTPSSTVNTTSTTTASTTNVLATLATTRPTPPSLRVVSKACKETSCTVQVLASEGAGLAAVAQVEAALTFLQAYPCHEGRLRFTCTRTVMRWLPAKPTPAGRFVILANGLKSGSYVLLLTAVDKAGVRQQTVARVGLLVKRPHSKR